MKAIMRWGVGLLSLLLLTSDSHGYVWVSPVFKCPLPCAPDCFGPGFWAQGPHGMWYGPNYYLMPPCGPFNGMLPGPTGAALMAGDGLPMMKGYKIAPPIATEMQGPQPGQPPFAGAMQGPQPGQLPHQPQQPLGYGYGPPMYQMPYSQPQPMLQPQPQPMLQPYPPPMQPIRPTAYVPYQGATGMTYMPMRQDPATGIWQVQNAGPNQGGAFRPIPSFNAPMPTGPAPQPTYMPQMMMPPGAPPMGTPPYMPGTPGMPGTPMSPGLPSMPMTPGMPSNMPYTTYGPTNGFQYYLQQGDPGGKMTPMQGPQSPRMDYAPMQLPRMDPIVQPPVRVGGPFPTHPFMRSPRDFFMWGETMDQERARGSRPYPVP